MLNKAAKIIMNFLSIFAGMLFLSLFILNVSRILLRYIWGIAMIWLPDLSRLLFIWLVFVGASVLVGGNEHLIMDFFISKLKPGNKRKLNNLIQLCQIAFFAVMFIGGIPVVKVRMRIPFDTWDFPTGWAYLAIPVCAAFMIIFSINNIANNSNKETRDE